MSELSLQQRRIVNVGQYGGPSRMVCVIHVEGVIEPSRIRTAVQHVIERHDILRRHGCEFRPDVDLGGAESVARWFESERYSRDNGSRPLECTCIALGTTRHALLLSLPAISADVHTASLLAREIAAACSPGVTTETPLQYAEYVEVLRELAEESGGASETSAPAPASCKRFEARSVPVEAEAAQIAEDLARRHGAYVSDVLLAAWQVLLCRFSGAREITVGRRVDGRIHEALEAAPGPFAAFAPRTAQVPSSVRFQELIMPQSDDADASQHFPLSFAFDDVSRRFESPGISVSVQTAYSCTDLFELQLTCQRTPDALNVEIEFDSSARSEAEARTMAECLVELLRSVACAPDTPVAELNMVTEPMLRRILTASNGAQAAAPLRVTHREFERVAAENPRSVAATHGESTLSFSEMNAAANRLARYLRMLGVDSESLIGIVMSPCIDVLASMLAIWKAGGAYVPLDPAAPPERLRSMLRDAGVRVVLAGSTVDGLDIPVVRVSEEWSRIEMHSDENLPVATDPLQLAYMIYTSGSTGTPKGVMISHGGLSNYLNWCVEQYAPGAGEGAPLHSSIAFDMAVTSLFAPLLAGRAVHIAGADVRLEALAEVVRKCPGFSFIKLTPAHARVLSSQLSPEQLSTAAKVVILGGEALTCRDIEAWRASARDTVFINEYGPTEAVVGCCVQRIEPGDVLDGPAPIGRPIANSTCYILDESMHLVPFGVVGELYIGGEGLARGYRNGASLTAEKFVPDPLSPTPGARLYRTGDLAVLTEAGHFKYRGRIDNQVKVRGYRVEPGEIEAAICEHPSVREAVLLVRGDRDGDQTLTACIVASGSRPGVEDLRAFLVRRLPEYMVPAAFGFVDALPLTRNGKVDRSSPALLELGRIHATAAYVAPRNDTEEILAGVWSQVLGVQRIGIDDNYFALGGDSIRSIQIAARAHARELKISVDQIFRTQTIRALAAAVVVEKSENQNIRTTPFSLIGDEDRAAVPDGIEDAYPLSRLQAGMVFHRRLNPESPVYHDIFYFDLRGPADPAVMRSAIRVLAARHPILRTSFDLASFSEPLQLVHRQAEVPLIVEDHCMLDEKSQAAAIEEWVKQEKQRDFDLARAPLLRFHMFLRSPDRFVFALTFHHAILDGWSDAMMLIELALRYRRLVRGEPDTAEALSSTYRDFIALEREAARSTESREFWRQYLDESSPAGLPPRAAEDVRSGVIVSNIRISDEVSAGLQAVARHAAVPLKSVLLAAHLRVIGFISGTADVLTTMTSVGRPETEDGDRVLGLHLNSTPFRLRLASGRWIDLVQKAFEVERAILPHRRFPLADLQSMLGHTSVAEHHFYFTHYHVVHKLDEFPELEIVGQGGFEATSFPLVANFSLHPVTLRLNPYLTCSLERFTPEQAEAMAGYYSRALTALALSPEANYQATSLLSAEESELVLRGMNRTNTTACEWKPVHEMVAAHVARTPDVPAIICGGRVCTYRELMDRASRIAGYLRSHGAGPEVRIGTSMRRSVDILASVLGTFMAGAVCVPLDASYPAERLDFMIRDAGVKLVLSGSEVGEPVLSGQVSPENAVYIVYTSGSTGNPKGIAIPHRVLSNLIEWHNETLVAGVRTLHAASISFDVSFYEMFAALCSGGAIVLADEEERVDASRLLRLLIAERVEKAILPVVMLNQIAAIGVDSGEFPTSLREVIVTGDQLAVTRQIATFFEALPECRLHNHYGPSETHVATAHPLHPVPGMWPALPPIGRPVANTQVYIVDRFLTPVPPGTAGELFIGGDALARGYIGRPDVTAERFVPDPFSASSGARLYRTGDLARLRPDSSIEFLGRADHQVKIRGYRVEPGEIESRLCEHPSIREAAVVARLDGRDDKRLVAYIVPSPAVDPPGDADICAFLSRTLPHYMIPAQFVWLDALPLNANGKVDRRALPAVELAAANAAETYTAPRTVTEEALVDFWAEVLGLARIGIHDNFFRSGGDSLLATRLTSVLRIQLAIDLPLRALFERPTIAQLAPLVEELLNQRAEVVGAE